MYGDDRKTNLVSVSPLMATMALIVTVPFLTLIGSGLWQEYRQSYDAKKYADKVAPIIREADSNLGLAQMMWEREFFFETADPLTKGKDPHEMLLELTMAKKQLVDAQRGFYEAEAEFNKLDAPMSAIILEATVAKYFEDGRQSITDLKDVVSYFEDEVLIEERIHLAIEAAGRAVSPEMVDSHMERDVVIETEIKNLESLDGPHICLLLHENKITWMKSYLQLCQESTLAASNLDFVELDRIGIRLEKLALSGEGRFNEDLDIIRGGLLAEQNVHIRELKYRADNEITRLSK